MLGRVSAGLVIALVSFSTVTGGASAATANQTATAKTATVQKSVAKAPVKAAKKQRIAYRSGRKGSYLVPPPPPYAPSILPELAYARARGYKKKAVEQQDEKQESSYKDMGVQAVEGYEDPEPVKTNKYVTYWNKS